MILLFLLLEMPSFAFAMGPEEIITLTHRCQKCHPVIYEDWKKSAHAKAAHDPWVVSMYNGSDLPGITLGPSYKASFPKSAGDCACCHAPDYAIKNPLNTDMNRVNDSVGVSCLFCHFTKRINQHHDGRLPGVQSIALKDKVELREGDIGCLIPRSSLKSKAIACAPCHYGKYHDVVVYPSYDEWSKSSPKRPCQGCHLKGGNHYLQIDRNLLSEGIDLKVKAWLDKDAMSFETVVANTGAGHFYPTGHPIRNVLLIIEARDASGRLLDLVEGNTIPSYGGESTASDSGYGYSGLPGKGFARVLEKVNPVSCYNESVPGPNALIGQSLALEQETRHLFPQEFWKRTTVLEDSRLAPHATYRKVFQFRPGAGNSKMMLTARLIYRKAFLPLARYYRWDMKDVVIHEVTKELQTGDRKEGF